jgi:hypothetical protein
MDPSSTAGRRHPIQRRALVRLVAALLMSGTREIAAMPPPTDPVQLTLSGHVLNPNEGKLAEFDMPMLTALTQHSFVTQTPWWAKPRRFTGPLLRDVLVAAGANGAQLRLSSLNDYVVELPFSDAERFDVIIARLIDNEPMAVRDKGPLFLIYPFDSQPELRNPIYYNRSAWQLRTIEVR